MPGLKRYAIRNTQYAADLRNTLILTGITAGIAAGLWRNAGPEYDVPLVAQPPADAPFAPLVAGGADGDGLEGLDPVCLMDADPTTAEYVVEHAGRRIGFCSAGCRERFLAEPAAYLAR